MLFRSVATLTPHVLARFRDPATARHDHVGTTLRESNRDAFSKTAVRTGNQTRASVEPDPGRYRCDARFLASLVDHAAQERGEGVVMSPLAHGGAL